MNESADDDVLDNRQPQQYFSLPSNILLGQYNNYAYSQVRTCIKIKKTS